VFPSRSSSTSSPVFTGLTNPRRRFHRVKFTVATLFRKKMRAKLSATTASQPAAPSAIGACSRELPQPKLRPPMTIVYGVCVWPSGMKRVDTGLRQAAQREAAELLVFLGNRRDEVQVLRRNDLVGINIVPHHVCLAR